MSNFGISNNGNINIGKYDDGVFDLADNVNIKKNSTVKTKQEALELTKKSSGADFVVERNTGKGLEYDVYDLKINDSAKKIHKLQDAKNLTLFDKVLDKIEKSTGTSNSVKAYVVAENGEIGNNVYNSQFTRSRYDKLRENLGLETSKPWFWLVDTVMGADSPSDDMPSIDKKEINNMKSHIKSGDILLNGNDGSFIHGILYVGKDPQLQQQLEKKWNLPAGSLKDEGIIIHSLLTDSDKEVDVNGKKEVRKAAGQGVNVDTIERYLERHPRDVMIAVEVKDATPENRKEAINTAKSFIGKKYDRAFNTYDDKEMYCTETVMKAWQGTSNPPKFETQRNPLVSYPKFVLDKLPEKVAKRMQDGGFLHQEMIMTDGIATSPSTKLVWASKNADKSEFYKKHERWANGMNDKVNPEYKKMLLEDVPNQANKSQEMMEQIKKLSDRSRNEIK
ncbi:MAG: YiiX/YebB-like N1pC/P60 family cysteine hydrolase [Candidatus Sericytochromatia bacterium]